MKPTPINNHVLIEPIAHDSFISTQKTTYEEIGIVVDVDPAIVRNWSVLIEIGSKVYFDSWLAVKYPIEGETDGYFWLVPYEAIRAKHEPLPE